MDYQLIKPIHDGYSAIEQVLTNRGIKFEDIDHYLNVSESDNLSPLLLKNIESAAKMILINLVEIVFIFMCKQIATAMDILQQLYY